MKSESRVPRGCALLLIDLQNDFVDGGSLAVPNGLEVIDIANRLIPTFDIVIATQDWHPRDHLSFASQHPGLAIGAQFQLGGRPQTAWPDHCVQGSVGAEFVHSLNQTAIDHVVRKGTDRSIDSYSGFYDNGRLRATGLTDYLQAQSVNHIFVCGLATDYCVRATVMDAIQDGFRTTLIVDGCRGVELQPGDIQRSLDEMRNAGAELVSSDEIV